MNASEKLMALNEAATPGPWQHSGDEEGRAGPKPTSHWDYYLSQEDADLVVVLANALPLIADQVRAAEDVLHEYHLWAEDANDGEFAIWSRDEFMAAFHRLQIAFNALNEALREKKS